MEMALRALYCVSTERMTSSPVGCISSSGSRRACVRMSSSQASQRGLRGLMEMRGGVGTLSSLSMSARIIIVSQRSQRYRMKGRLTPKRLETELLDVAGDFLIRRMEVAMF